ncbi:toxin-antitoxin system YwqK family antitoxin [Cellvibrio mixtus]|uniref:toxin-antitoxin system YwqK family antitoxin n=1 Tax=Cellvibrio mixtus TaxID=39650 RepID=UPI000586CA51|nr:hypothetical protein [Cellvibrio mixtus]
MLNKYTALICTFFVTLIVTGCNQTIDARQLKLIQGLHYKINDNEPFTGTVTNYRNLGAFSTSCSVEMKEGQLDGNFECKTKNGFTTTKLEYKNNLKNGVEQVWDEESGNLVSKTSWKEGKRDGSDERYNYKTGKLIQITHWSENRKEGEEKIWDASGEKLLTHLDWEDGKQSGFSTWSEWEENYKDGKLHGTRKHFGLKQNASYDEYQAASTEIQLLNAGTFSIGLLKDGYVQWEEEYENGNLISKTEYEHK